MDIADVWLEPRGSGRGVRLDTPPALGSCEGCRCGQTADASFIFLYIGAPQRALEPYEEGGSGPADFGFLWHPTYSPARKTERFKKIVRDEGLVAYWRERGWPPFCRPLGAADFECE